VRIVTIARARELPGLEADGKRVWAYKHALQPPHMPKNLLVIGSGLIGTSVALALRRAGLDVLLSDRDESCVLTAVEAGAGRALEPSDVPEVVIVAVPPRHAGEVLAEASGRWPEATISDVTSVKQGVLVEAVARGADASRLVGGHPMAGREVSGPAAAVADLLDDRLWVVTPLPQTRVEHVRRIHRLISACGALPVEMDPQEHDAAVALVSHAPQVLSSVLAAQLAGTDEDSVRIAGQGLRDMTRIAGSNVDMWSDILSANAGPVADVLQQVASDIERAVDSLRSLAASAALSLALLPLWSAQGLAEPRVVASIKPVHALVAAVMEGVGTPDLIVGGAASPPGSPRRRSTKIKP